MEPSKNAPSIEAQIRGHFDRVLKSHREISNSVDRSIRTELNRRLARHFGALYVAGGGPTVATTEQLLIEENDRLKLQYDAVVKTLHEQDGRMVRLVEENLAIADKLKAIEVGPADPEAQPGEASAAGSSADGPQQPDGAPTSPATTGSPDPGSATSAGSPSSTSSSEAASPVAEPAFPEPRPEEGAQP